MANLLCKLGWHKFSKWQLTGVWKAFEYKDNRRYELLCVGYRKHCLKCPGLPKIHFKHVFIDLHKSQEFIKVKQQASQS